VPRSRAQGRAGGPESHAARSQGAGARGEERGVPAKVHHRQIGARGHLEAAGGFVSGKKEATE
ncbi:MAG: hypothetical protein BJ554DRAFT_4962, partial [Olpidium bornovanus]